MIQDGPSPKMVVGCLAATAVGVFVGIPALIFGSAYVAGYNSTDAGHVLVMRHGGWFSDKNISQIIPAASGLTSTGFFTTGHAYPVPQQQYTITADANNGAKSGADVITVPSADGVQMDIEGTLYYTLDTSAGTDPKNPYAVLKKFDDTFGTRDFTYDGVTKHPYEGNDGWGVFMNAMVRPTVNEALRDQLGTVRCAELVASCALVQNNGGASLAASFQSGTSKIADVQKAVAATLQTDINNNLGGQYFTNITFVINGVRLPDNVQQAVNEAQAAFAKVSQVQAQVAQANAQVQVAQAQAKSNEAQQQGYNACPTCAQIDIIKALPNGLQVYAPGSNTAVPLSGTGVNKG